MANPNLANVSSGYGRMAFQNVTTLFSNIIANAVASNTLLKVNSLFVSNIDASNTGNISVNIANTNIGYSVITNASVPIQSTIIAITKDSSVYLEEGQYMQIKASANNAIQAVVSFDIIG